MKVITAILSCVAISAATAPVNGLVPSDLFSAIGGQDPAGAISGAEFEQVQIIDGKAYLDVRVYTSDAVTRNLAIAALFIFPGISGFPQEVQQDETPAAKPVVGENVAFPILIGIP